jgi:hypothetical protein
MVSNKFLALAFAITASSMLLSGCKEDENTVSPATTPSGTANVMAIHASPNASSVDLLVDNTVVGTNLSYPNNTNYLSVSAGTRNVKVRVSGGSTVVIDANLPVSANTNYSVFAVDSVSKISALVLTDNLATPAAGKGHVRFVHLSPNAPAVDIALRGGAVVFPNTAFKGSTAFTPLDAGTYDLDVRVAGTTNVVLQLSAITVQEGGIYTVFAKGFLSGTGNEALGAQIVVNKVPPARVMTIHASPNAPGVDLLVDGTIAGTNLTFPNNTPYLGVAAGMRNIRVNVTGTTTTVINATLDLTGGTSYSVFASDSVSKIAPVVLTDDLTTPATGNAHVRFIHISPNAPAVDVALQGGAVVFGNRAFKQFTAFTPLAAGTYNLEVRVAGTSTVVLPLPNITLQAGKIYTVFAKGFVGGSGTQALGAQIIVNN